MGILYAISILAFALLLWATLSIAQHIRRSHVIEESGEPLARKPASGERPFLEPATPTQQKVARPFEFFDPREFHAHPTQNRPVPMPVPDELQTHDLPIHGVRRPPRPAPGPRVSDRLDWAYYNKDLGDLKDPEPTNRPRTTQPNTARTNNIRQA